MRQRLASVISASGVCWVVSRLLHGCIAHSLQTRDINVSVRYRLTQLSFLVCLQPRIYLFVIFCFIQIMAPTKKKKVTCRSDMPRARPKRPTPARGKQTMACYLCLGQWHTTVGLEARSASNKQLMSYSSTQEVQCIGPPTTINQRIALTLIFSFLS